MSSESCRRCAPKDIMQDKADGVCQLTKRLVRAPDIRGRPSGRLRQHYIIPNNKQTLEEGREGGNDLLVVKAQNVS